MRKFQNPDDVIGKLLSYRKSPGAESVIGICVSRRRMSIYTADWDTHVQPAYILGLLVGEDIWDVFENDHYLRLLK